MSMSMGYVGGVLGRLGFGGIIYLVCLCMILAQDNIDRYHVCVYISYI